MTTRFVGSDVPIAVHEFGNSESPAVLAVHGFASSAGANWDATGWVRLLTAAGYRVVAVDQRGHGLSARPHEAGAYSLGVMASDLAMVLDELELEQVHYLGYSLGSRVGCELASRNSSRLITMTLGGFSGYDPFASFDLTAANRYLIDGEPVRDPTTAELISMARALPGNDTAALVALVEGVVHEHSPLVPAEITVPTLVVNGQLDQIALDGAAFAALLPRGKFVEVPARTHATSITSQRFKQSMLAQLQA
jgi:pimeloyl-ACP methyl ester carboxylesterase